MYSFDPVKENGFIGDERSPITYEKILELM